jgi:AcrR family transcriptional regulator
MSVVNNKKSPKKPKLRLGEARKRPKRAHVSEPPVARQPRQQRAQQTVEAVLEAAGQVLIDRGYAKSTTNAIAERAGVSIGSLYQYYRNKDDIYAALKRRHLAHIAPLTETLAARILQPNSDIAFEIGRFMETLVNAHEPAKALVFAIDRELSWLKPADFGFKDVHPSWAKMVEKLLVERAPTVTDPVATAHLLIATIELLSKWIAHFAPTSVEPRTLINGVTRMVRGLLGQSEVVPRKRSVRNPRPSR